MAKRTVRQKLWRALKILVAVYVGLGMALYFTQDLFLFHPTPLKPDHVFRFDKPFRELNIPVENRNLSVVQFAADTTKTKKGIVLYFHGNRQNIERYAPFADVFTQKGYEVWMMDYPGFGKSTGKRTEAALYHDALLLYNLALKNCSPDRIIIYGKSLGTGIAAQLASIRSCRQLILETPYYSVDALARHYFPIYPVMPMTHFAFPTYQRLKTVQAPITIFHGTKDEVIPYKQAKKLKEENKQINLITLKRGRHNNLYQHPVYYKVMAQLLP